MVGFGGITHIYTWLGIAMPKMGIVGHLGAFLALGMVISP